MDPAHLERVRSFNRTVTRRIGVLDDSYLGRGRPLGEARLLFEIGRGTTDLKELRERLGLDSGYLSRLLRRLERQGLIRLAADAGDRRRRRAELTAAGRVEHAAYEALSDDLAGSMLEPLGAAERQRLVAAMAEVERLLVAATVRIAAEPPDAPDAQACLAAYFRELDERFEAGFDPGRGGPAARPERMLVTRCDGHAVGCGALQRLDDWTAEIKRMWVAPEMRGRGLARRLLGALEDEARALGFARVRLDTNRALGEAQALYRRAGYRDIPRYNDNPYADFWFEKEL